MKTSKILFLSALIIILLSITIFIAFLKLNFERGCIEGKGNIIDKEFNLQHFNGISINNPFHLEITQDSIQKVINELTADANSGGNIQYSGNPKKTNINSNSGGTVSRLE
jgi:hypothetical protein